MQSCCPNLKVLIADHFRRICLGWRWVGWYFFPSLSDFNAPRIERSLRLWLLVQSPLLIKQTAINPDSGFLRLRFVISLMVTDEFKNIAV